MNIYWCQIKERHRPVAKFKLHDVVYHVDKPHEAMEIMSLYSGGVVTCVRLETQSTFICKEEKLVRFIFHPVSEFRSKFKFKMKLPLN